MDYLQVSVIDEPAPSAVYTGCEDIINTAFRPEATCMLCLSIVRRSAVEIIELAMSPCFASALVGVLQV